MELKTPRRRAVISRILHDCHCDPLIRNRIRNTIAFLLSRDVAWGHVGIFVVVQQFALASIKRHANRIDKGKKTRAQRLTVKRQTMNSTKAKGSKCAPAARTFPTLLHNVLFELERNGQSHIASWQPHGRSFKIHNREAFVATVLPRRFKTTKFSSFQRQLNLYEFVRVSTGCDRNSQYHELFVRDQPRLALGMTRVKVKGQGPRRPLSIVTVPNVPLAKEDLHSSHASHSILDPTSATAVPASNDPNHHHRGTANMTHNTSLGRVPTLHLPLTFHHDSLATTVSVPTDENANDGRDVASLLQDLCLEQLQQEESRRKELGQFLRHLMHQQHAQDQERRQQLETLVLQLLSSVSH